MSAYQAAKAAVDFEVATDDARIAAGVLMDAIGNYGRNVWPGTTDIVLSAQAWERLAFQVYDLGGRLTRLHDDCLAAQEDREHAGRAKA